MANVYFIDGGDHDWNTVANWYSSPGAPCAPCCPTPPVPLGRLPAAATDAVLLIGVNNKDGGTGYIGTGPTGGYTGPMTITGLSGNGNSYGGAAIQAGDYSGALTIEGLTDGITASVTGGTFTGSVDVLSTGVASEISGGTFDCPLSVTLDSSATSNVQISGGAFTGAITVENNSASASLYGLQISGGEFSGSFALSLAGTHKALIEITGGSFAPSVSVSVAGGVISDPDALPWDPGFSQLSPSGYDPTIAIAAGLGVLGIQKGFFRT